MSEPASLLPIDCGFDVKVLQMPLDVSSPRMRHVRFLDREGQEAEAEGDAATVATILIDAGYYAVVVEHTANGREIRLESDGLFHVQPADDNYWLTVETLDDARNAYWHPEDSR